MSTKNRTRRTTTRNIRFPNQMIEQINIALDQKGSGISQPGSLKPAAEDCAQKKEFRLKQTKKRVTLLNCSESRSDQIEAI